MIKKLLTVALFATGLCANAQSFTALYDFAAVTPSTGTTDPSAVPVVSGLTCGSFVAVGTSSVNPTATGRFSFTAWPIATLSGSNSASSYTAAGGSINLNQYYEVTLTPQSGYTIALNSFSFTVQRSGTGIRSYAVRTNADNYVNNLPASVITNTNLSIVAVNEFFWNVDATTSAQNGSFINLFGATLSGATSFRFYGWNSEASGGTFSIDNVTFNGTVSITTGLSNLSFDLNSNFNVYPVPSNDGIVYIENKNAQELSNIEIIDMLGNIVVSSKNETGAKITLNTNDLSAGNYSVKITSANGVATKKLVVTK